MEMETEWILDPAHSEIAFKVKHLMMTNIKGEFREFEITLTSEGNDFSNAKVLASVNTQSVFTNNAERDTHLRSTDFFDAEQFRKMTFQSRNIQKLDSQNYRLTGVLSMKGIDREVFFHVEFAGLRKDPGGNFKAGFSITGKINRRDWGLNWNAALDAGGVLVSDDVRMTAELQFLKKS